MHWGRTARGAKHAHATHSEHLQPEVDAADLLCADEHADLPLLLQEVVALIQRVPTRARDLRAELRAGPEFAGQSHFPNPGIYEYRSQ